MSPRGAPSPACRRGRSKETTVSSGSGAETIPLAVPDLRDEDRRAVLEVLESDRLAMGPWTERFERALADAVGVRHAVATSSGTGALHIILSALGIADGDEVITTPFSFIASANCILYVRATPVFVDIERDGLCIDPRLVEAAITPRTKAILAVDVFGRPAAWEALERIAADHGLTLIEDAAEALGSTLGGRRCGSFGTAAAFGFYPNKQITTGEGGAIVTDDAVVGERCRSLCNQGRDASSSRVEHVRIGFNYRIDELSAALGAIQIGRLEEIVARREEIAAWYQDELGDCDRIALPQAAPGSSPCWFVYVVRLHPEVPPGDRDRILAGLRARGIGCRDYFAPIHLQPSYRELLGHAPGAFPVCESVAGRTIALPFHHRLSRAQVETVGEALRAELDGLR
ncbi:MAG: DegT/DnrJ/EryC1/StrS family aminotransferase [Candidatus Bipolaricaulota bacterium]|nr:MAG: DegT/DnrJ/EryC1/StrS family aminotransferase [Candidatus Bipolaricaulota bacterium]